MRPKIVCLCGSSRAWWLFERMNLQLTLQGCIVLSIGAFKDAGHEHHGSLSIEDYEQAKAGLDELHKRKIDLADQVMILNEKDYIGESTAAEIAYALKAGKYVEYLEPHGPNKILSEGLQPSSKDGVGAIPPIALPCRLVGLLKEWDATEKAFDKEGKDDASCTVFACRARLQEVVEEWMKEVRMYQGGRSCPAG